MAPRARKQTAATKTPQDTKPAGELTEQPGHRKRKRWWRCGPVKCFLLVVAAIFILNYASLKRETQALMPTGRL